MTIQGEGTTRFFLSAMLADDRSALRERDRMMKGEENPLEEVLEALEWAKRLGVGRSTRRGWYLMQVKGIGEISFKSGIARGPVLPYFLVRHNGKLKIKASPKEGRRYVYAVDRDGNEIPEYGYLRK